MDTGTLGVTDPEAKKARAERASSATTRRKRKAATPRARGLLASLLQSTLLSDDDRRAVRAAHSTGLTLQDLAALTVYELRLAHKLYAMQELPAKDFLVGINKASSHIAAVAQLAQASPGGATSVTVTFAAPGQTSDRPEAAQSTARDPQIGDVVDTE
jgi:hypothetical protein